MNRVRKYALVFFLCGSSACSSEPTNPMFQEDPSENPQMALQEVSPHRAMFDVKELRMDLPPSPRPWDTDPMALLSAVAEARGRGMIGLKSPASRKVLENNGIRSGMSRLQFQAGLDALHGLGVEVTAVFQSIGAVTAMIDPETAPEIQRHPMVDYVEPAKVWTVQGTEVASEDLAVPMPFFAQTTPWGASVVRAPQVWSEVDGDGATVLVIDTGHDQGHADLPSVPGDNCWGTYLGCTDTVGHGTHVLGDLTARDNTTGAVGVAPGLDGSDVYVWAACQSSTYCDTNEIAMALDSASAWEVDVVSMSLGGAYDTGIANAAAGAWGNDVFLVAAAGNDTGSTVIYPAGLSSVLGVSGVRTDSSFASTSPCNIASGHGVHVDLSAPFWSYNAEPGDTYSTMCGTSMATPHVAAAAAMIRAEHPALPNYSVWSRLTGTSEDLGTSEWDAYFGEGLLDVLGALGPFAEIEGFVTIQPNQTCEWLGRYSGGKSPFSYQWYRNGNPVGTESSYSYEVGASGFELRLTITDDDGWSDTEVVWIVVSAQGEECEA